MIFLQLILIKIIYTNNKMKSFLSAFSLGWAGCPLHTFLMNLRGDGQGAHPLLFLIKLCGGKL